MSEKTCYGCEHLIKVTIGPATGYVCALREDVTPCKSPSLDEPKANAR